MQDGPDGAKGRNGAPLRERVHGFLFRVFGADGDLKVLSLAVAAVLFLLVRPKVYTTETFDVPASVETGDSTYLADVRPSSVKVTLRGPVDVMAKLKGSGFSVCPKLEKRELSTVETVEITSSDVRHVGRKTANVRFVSAYPESLEVHLDRHGSFVAPKNYILKPKLVGTTQGHVRAEFEDDFDEVLVYGPMSKLAEFRAKKIGFATTPVNVEGVTKDFETFAEIQIPQDSGITEVKPSRVKVKVVFTPQSLPGKIASEPKPLSREEADAIAAKAGETAADAETADAAAGSPQNAAAAAPGADESGTAAGPGGVPADAMR